MNKETVICELKVEPSVLGNVPFLKECVLKVLKEAGVKVRRIFSEEFTPYGVTLFIVLEQSHCILHTYPEEGLLSVDVYTCGDVNAGVVVNWLCQELQPERVSNLRTIRQDGQIYVIEDDLFSVSMVPGLEVSYRVNKVLCSFRSKYQKIDVVEHPVFGKMLFLDGVAQLSESDIHLYNEAMLRGLEVKDKQFIILGGGDGFLADELVKQGASYVKVVEIDKDVADICNKFFDKGNKISGVHWVYQDALELSEDEFEGKIVLLDLTDIPLGSDTRVFFTKIFSKLKKADKVVVYAGSVLNRPSIALIEKCLKDEGFKTKKWERFIPSYMTLCVFIRGEK
ncbi:MAG: adenosylmethionine decarboxylase [candidate division WOR-3 bacterium]|nr:adenosylmethionine decarboxylase [candidate division WOR-3 bacterium]